MPSACGVLVSSRRQRLESGTAFTKPVDRPVSEAIEAWEAVRLVELRFLAGVPREAFARPDHSCRVPEDWQL